MKLTVKNYIIHTIYGWVSLDRAIKNKKWLNKLSKRNTTKLIINDMQMNYITPSFNPNLIHYQPQSVKLITRTCIIYSLTTEHLPLIIVNVFKLFVSFMLWTFILIPTRRNIVNVVLYTYTFIAIEGVTILDSLLDATMHSDGSYILLKPFFVSYLFLLISR